MFLPTEARPRRRARTATTAALWGAALASILGVSWSIGTAAFAAAPANDAIMPTANYATTCGAGISANSVCQTDNAGVSYYMDSSGEYELESVDRSITSTAAEKWDSATALTVTYDSSPSFSGSAETDVIVQEGAFGYPDNYHGITWCNDPISSTRCDQHYIRMRGNNAINAFVAMHEFGHAWGLLHPGSWAPARADCDGNAYVMVRWEDCGIAATIGPTLVNNVNWIYG